MSRFTRVKLKEQFDDVKNVWGYFAGTLAAVVPPTLLIAGIATRDIVRALTAAGFASFLVIVIFGGFLGVMTTNWLYHLVGFTFVKLSEVRDTRVLRARVVDLEDRLAKHEPVREGSYRNTHDHDRDRP